MVIKNPTWLMNFIPWSPTPVTHGDAVEQEGEGGGTEPEFAFFNI
jgi:hypothetical protein